MATMNQAIRQMLSRRTQLAALMVVVALAAASFIALSDTARAQTPPVPTSGEDATLELLIYFPEDSDGVVASRGSQNTGLERVKVTFELRATVPNAAGARVRLVRTAGGDVYDLWRDATTGFGRTGTEQQDWPPVTAGSVQGVYPTSATGSQITRAFDWLDLGQYYSSANDSNPGVEVANRGLANRGNYISVSSPLRFWDAGTPTVYLDNRDAANGAGNNADEVVWDCRDAARNTERPYRLTHAPIPANAGTDSCYLQINGQDPQVDLVSVSDGTYTIRGAVVPQKSDPTIFADSVLGIEWDGLLAAEANDPPINRFGPNLIRFAVRTDNLSASRTLTVKTVKEVEAANSSFTLATNTAMNTPCPGAAGDACPDTISAVRDPRETSFTLSLKNADGGASNWNAIRRIQLDVRGTGNIATSYTASGVNSVRRESIGSTIVSWAVNAGAAASPWGTDANGRAIGADAIGQLKLRAAGSQTGTAEVSAQVLTATGEQIQFDPILVTITGKAASFEITEPTATLYRAATTADDRDKLTLASSATDKADGTGNPVHGDALRTGYKITGPDGKSAKASFEDVTRATSGAGRGNIVLQLKSTTTGTAALTPGTYTFEGSIGTETGLKDSVNFTVAGPAAEDGISVEFDPAEPSTVGEEVTATITVRDAAGNAVADGTGVTLSVSDSAGTGAALRTVGSNTPRTKGGVATVRMVAIGDGLAIVTVTADSQVSVSTVRSRATSASQVRGVEGLSRSDVNQFASWEPTNTVQASELFDDLFSRGASALYRWDQSSRSWQRYAEDASSRLVPGSVNFQIARGDTLYIAG